MNYFYVITNEQKDPDYETAGYIQSYLEEKGKTCYVQQPNAGQNSGAYKYTDARKIPQDVECVLVLGGDGTLLQAARDLVERSIPLLGVNMGTLGFLAEIEKKNLQAALDQLIQEDYSVEDRMMLCGTAWHQERQLLSDIALNDIVIGRNGRLRVIDFSVYVDGVYLTSYSADGIIVSTPTGSTGYNLSAGGPIVAPQASLIVITALAPHTLNSRPIVLPDDVEITIEIGANRMNDGDGAEATFDGDTSVKLNAGDKIVIAKSGRKARLVKTKHTSFLEVLREKLGN